jgi:superoxide dismutase, Cu-Zn family
MKKSTTGSYSGRTSLFSEQSAAGYFSLLLVVSLFLSACGSGSKQAEEGEADTEQQQAENNEVEKATAKAVMEPASGSKVSGQATFTQENGTVVFELTVENVTPGEHAVHLHEKGDCSSEDASSAGGHWNPTMKPHGKRGNGTAFHKGDIANMNVGQDGKGTLRMSIGDWTIGGPDSTNVVGKSVIVHAKPDDFTSQPSGNAGDRISCGVIKEE